MKSALEHYSTQGNCLKMTTGSGEFDSLSMVFRKVCSIYSMVIRCRLDGLSHRLLVNCILSVKEHGFESMAVCFNNTDYYGRGKMILNPEKIANTAKVANIEPKVVSKNSLYSDRI